MLILISITSIDRYNLCILKLQLFLSELYTGPKIIVINYYITIEIIMKDRYFSLRASSLCSTISRRNTTCIWLIPFENVWLWTHSTWKCLIHFTCEYLTMDSFYLQVFECGFFPLVSVCPWTHSIWEHLIDSFYLQISDCEHST